MKTFSLASFGATLAVTLMASEGRSDDVHLNNGGVISGIVRTESDWITLEVPSGTVSFPATQVSRIERSRHALHEYYEREASLGNGKDPAAIYRLASWCKENGLGRLSVDLSKRIVVIEPEHEGARALLGHQKRDGRWLSTEEARRADGQVEFRGRWMAATERDRILRDEEDARQAALARYDERRQQEEERRKEAARNAPRQETLVMGIGSVGEPYHHSYNRARYGRGRGGHFRGLRGFTRPGSTIRR